MSSRYTESADTTDRCKFLTLVATRSSTVTQAKQVHVLIFQLSISIFPRFDELYTNFQSRLSYKLLSSDVPPIIAWVISTLLTYIQRAETIKNALDELYAALLPAIQDAGEAGNQSVAYNVFFKDTENGAEVSNLLASISEGAPSYPPPDSITDGAPAFVCLTGSGQVTGNLNGNPIDGFDTCTKPGLYAGAASMTGTKYIIICPIFWTLQTLLDSPPAPPANNQPANNCLRLSRNGQQFGGSPVDRHGAAYLVQYRTWILLEELVHAYIHTTKGFRTVDSTGGPILEVYDANGAYELSAADSLWNAPSYVLYVASKSTHSLIKRSSSTTSSNILTKSGLYGHCTFFPPTTRGRRLLDAAPDLAANPQANATDLAYAYPTPVSDIVVNTQVPVNFGSR